MKKQCTGCVWDGVKFFTIAVCTGLCFGFVTKTMLITRWCFHRAYTASQPFLPLTQTEWGCGCTRSWEGKEPGQLTRSDLKDIPEHVASCSAVKRRLVGRGCWEWLSIGELVVSNSFHLDCLVFSWLLLSALFWFSFHFSYNIFRNVF